MLPKSIQVPSEESTAMWLDLDQDTKSQRKLFFQSISFKGKLDEFDHKYTRGRFGYQRGGTPESSQSRVKSAPQDRSIPRVGLLSSAEQGNFGDLAMSLHTDANYVLDSDTTEEESTTDISESVDDGPWQEATDEDARPLSTLKRKRSPEEGHASHINTPQCSSISGGKSTAEKVADSALYTFSRELDSKLIGFLAPVLQALTPETPKYHGNNRDFMQIAQSVVEQLSLATDFLSDLARNLDEPYGHTSGNEITHCEDPLRTVIPPKFPSTETLNLHQLNVIGRETREAPEGTGRDNVISRIPQKESMLWPKTPTSPHPLTGSFSLSVPHARIRRNQKPIDILGSALHFWEELGLEPAHGSKNILAVYMYPAIHSVREGLQAFATMVGSSYRNCKLGTHESILTLSGYPDGLIPVLGCDGTAAEKAAQLNLHCEKLGEISADSGAGVDAKSI